MTRFARARGSKSSNQKLPEEATPWSQMKHNKQLNSSIEDDSKLNLHIEDKKQNSFFNVEKFDGFSVLKEDAAELRLQKSKLIKQGIPRNQLKAHLLPFRRRAEKKLSRLRQKMCFHCRQPGHMLNQCPKLGSNTALGVCFKCGSTEHKLQECRNTSFNQLEYAKCFICNEDGHLSRQCPDNPMGLYPNGGACRLCGDVTHFAKDCPEKQKRKREEEELPTVGFIDNKAIEELDNNQGKIRKDLSGFNGNKGLKKKKLVIMK